MRPDTQPHIRHNSYGSEGSYSEGDRSTTRRLGKGRQIHMYLYRRVLDKIFMSTPSNLPFRCHCYSAVTQHTAETLTEIWGIFGQIDVSHSIYVLFSAALHVESSAEEDTLFLSQDDLSQQEELYNHLTSQLKSCIFESIRGAGTQKDFNIHNLVCGVRRKLSLRGQTSRAQKCALKWWKKVSDDIYSSLDYLVH
jgi:hypothetical protein